MLVDGHWWALVARREDHWAPRDTGTSDVGRRLCCARVALESREVSRRAGRTLPAPPRLSANCAMRAESRGAGALPPLLHPSQPHFYIVNWLPHHHYLCHTRRSLIRYFKDASICKCALYFSLRLRLLPVGFSWRTLWFKRYVIVALYYDSLLFKTNNKVLVPTSIFRYAMFNVRCFLCLLCFSPHKGK